MEEQSYSFPSHDLLIKDNIKNDRNSNLQKDTIEKFFRSYNIDIECKEMYKRGNATTYVVDLKYKTRVKTITAYKEEIMMNFNVIDVEFIKAINGTPYLGIQLIDKKSEVLRLGDMIDSEEYKMNISKIPIIVGKNFSNHVIVEDLSELPHLLIAGTTGTGKSNFLSTIIMDIIYKLNPEEIKLILVDTRLTNFLRFNGIPHLLIPVIVQYNKTLGMLAYLIQEMNNRYELFQRNNVDNIDSYNETVSEKLPRIVVMIEDFCDLMMDTNGEIEKYVIRLVQMSRAAGIHVIISTQRPSTDVITGLIKANMPARIAFKVPSQFDSKTIIDVAGAEELLIYGEILFKRVGLNKLQRIQTPYISDEEVENIIDFVKENN